MRAGYRLAQPPSVWPIDVSEVISPDDGMFAGDHVPGASDHYFSVGLSALRAIELSLLALGRGWPRRILDLPCGHGRVLRVLRAAFPEAEIAACDIVKSGVEFCAEAFGARPIYSDRDPNRIPVDGQFDLIWCGSLFTHLGAADWDSFLQFFAAKLAPDGLLVFTSHGRWVAERLRRGEADYGLLPDQVARVVDDYRATGFGYSDYFNQQGFGISAAAPGWIVPRLQAAGDLKVVSFSERQWDDHQDVFACTTGISRAHRYLQNWERAQLGVKDRLVSAEPGPDTVLASVAPPDPSSAPASPAPAPEAVVTEHDEAGSLPTEPAIPFAGLRPLLRESDTLPDWRDPEPFLKTPSYDHEVDLSADKTEARIIDLVGRDKRVLELGCATGYMTKVFRERGCTVVGVEVDADAAEKARLHCERVIVGDLDVMDLQQELGDDVFDAVVAADVLEHLKDPQRVLRALHPHIRPDGYIVASVPNIAHASVRLALLSGRFDYQDAGLLDRTHLRFFTIDSIDQLFAGARYSIVHLIRQRQPIGLPETSAASGLIPVGLAERLAADPEAMTYQYLLVASAVSASRLDQLHFRLRELVAQSDNERQRIAETLRQRDEADRAIRRELADAESQYKGQVAGLQGTVQQLLDQTESLQHQVSQHQREADLLRAGANERLIELEALQSGMLARDAEATSLRADVADRDLKISLLSSRLQDAAAQGIALDVEGQERLTLGQRSAGLAQRTFRLARRATGYARRVVRRVVSSV